MSIQVSTANDVKVYNISTGKSLPEWISERKRRSLLKNDESLRRRIELIQDFKMPTATNVVTLTPDTQYIFTAGVYKPRICCYDTSQLSMKFERCVDNEVVAMTMLSEDYSKFVLLETNRKLEFHVQHGHYYSTRIPTFGRDMTYHYPSCDLYIAASGSDIYRLNLEQGMFLSSLTTVGSGSNAISLCKEHQLLAVGTEAGRIECFDPRSRSRVGILSVTTDNSPVTAVKFNNALTLGVGTDSGVVKLYDVRSSVPFAVKEHHYQLPIQSVSFQSHDGLVLSADKKAVRIWNISDCTPFTSIEPEHDINSMCPVPGTGLIFLAVEHSQVLSYFIPSLGPAPKWCSFLDSLTEELEETPQSNIYDDYKFVTSKDLEELGLSHLIGTNLLRAYMHGYFVDIRLYHKARSIAQPFAYEEYRKNKIREKIEEERQNRVQKKALPKVNRELAKKLMSTDETSNDKKKGKAKKTEANPMTDDRFSALFSNPDFQVDTDSQEYKQLNPLLSQAMKLQDRTMEEEEEEEDEYEEREYIKTRLPFPRPTEPVISIEKGDVQKGNRQLSKLLLGERLIDSEPQNKQETVETSTGGASIGNALSTFNIRKESALKQKQASIVHRRERKSIRRSASNILPKRKGHGVYWKGRRIK